MIHLNLQRLRKNNNYTQEQLAELLNVSRQVVSKWESGESTPDVARLQALAELYHVTIDTLVNYTDEGTGLPAPPKGKYFFGSVTVGERGQMVIPKKAREIFHIQPGDTLMILGDEDRGLAIVPQNYMKPFFEQMSFQQEEIK